VLLEPGAGGLHVRSDISYVCLVFSNSWDPCKLSSGGRRRDVRHLCTAPPSQVVVAAYHDLTGDELAERIPVHRLELLANDPGISRLPVLTVPALDPG
jgi:hypothetical protein